MSRMTALDACGMKLTYAIPELALSYGPFCEPIVFLS
jgi:hypothetical protein